MIGHIERAMPQLSREQQQKLCDYHELLMEGNARFNLTAIKEPEEVAYKHFYDSLLAMPFIKQGARCIDVGTGGGMPGIPLLIARPDITLTLLDSTGKKVEFLKETLNRLSLKAECVYLRAELAGQDFGYRAKYDVALARAVAPLSVLLELCVPFLRVGGQGIAYKGKSASEEMEKAKTAAALLGCSLRNQTVCAPYGDRALILFSKEQKTSNKYPRRAGEPARKPL